MTRSSFLPPLLPFLCGLILAGPAAFTAAAPPDDTPVWLDPDQALEVRVRDLVSRMTLEEKVAQLSTSAPAIDRLGLPAYEYLTGALPGIVTSFPQPLGLAATFNPPLVFRVASAIGDEARARFQRPGDEGGPGGLHLLGPSGSILRDPRWGRACETLGEDPFLASFMTLAFARGLQGDELQVIGEDKGPPYLKTVAVLRDFGVFSGPESERDRLDVTVSLEDLRETYLVPFAMAAGRGHVASLACSSGSVNGQPACASEPLLYRFLRGEWAFQGPVVSECGAVEALWHDGGHGYLGAPATAAAVALRRGTDLRCGEGTESLLAAFRESFVTEDDLDRALARVLTTRFRLGLFDPSERVRWTGIGPEAVGTPEHDRLALEAARQSIVLLRNEGGVLPLSKDLGRVAIFGPPADDGAALVNAARPGGARPVTPLQGIRAKLPGAEVVLATDVTAAREADAVIAVLGVDDRDRTELGLPGSQRDLLESLVARGTPVVLALVSGGPVAVPWAAENVPAILQLWRPGQAGGAALADILFGDDSPGGRLPVTIPRSVKELPPFEDYAMEGRTYRFFAGTPLYPFGHGLSYTRFAYSKLRMTKRSPKVNEPVAAAVRVTNVGDVAGDEVLQLYIEHLSSPTRTPIRALRGVQRIHLEPGQSEFVDFALYARYLTVVDEEGRVRLLPGRVRVSVGGCQPGYEALCPGTEVVTTEIEIAGDAVTVVP